MKLGNNEIDKIWLETTEVKKMYLGSSLIYNSSPAGESIYNTPGVNSWTCPNGVTEVSVVCVGAGGGGISYASGAHYMFGGAGGGLGYKNNIPVVPGNTYAVQVGLGGIANKYSTKGTAGGDSFFITAETVKGGGGGGGGYNSVPTAGSYTGDGGGNGGTGNGSNNKGAIGGGGAGGYSGNGGIGTNTTNTESYTDAPAGGGGSGGYTSSSFNGSTIYSTGYGGGGVGLLGEGASGGGTNTFGIGGSGGNPIIGETPIEPRRGGLYGGGGGGNCSNNLNGDGADGGVRIIWGENRAFPMTNCGQDKSETITVN